MVEVSKNKDFQKKINGRQESGSSDFGGGWHPQFEQSNLFVCICSLNTLGHKLSNKVLGNPLASILSDWRPLEKNFGGNTKIQKTLFFCIWLIYLRF